MADRNNDDGEPEILAPEELVQQDGKWFLRHRNKSATWAEPKGSVPALDKGIRILAFLNEQENAGSTLAAIASTLNITRSHCHGLLKTLVAHDWLYFDERAKAYRLNAGVLRDFSSLLDDRSHVAFVRPYLESVCRQTGVPTIVSRVLPDGSFVVADKVSAPLEMEISYPIGHWFPRDAPVQMRAHLAWRSPDEIDAWFSQWEPHQYSHRTVTDRADIQTELIETRRRGYARSIGEFTDGLMALALPIFSPNGAVQFIISCISTYPTLVQKEAGTVAELVKAASEIHGLFGSIIPDDFPRPVARHGSQAL
ncbi:IclR family transcriptional regulator [Fodinicurvata sp. EGI_FJ10296]|uniref:IclR family transcriptional regulator n=1 Tax=Fodinicurvata sp. EGI_FJ10296 TaxID=3231908 RepID=UPI003451CD1A